MDPVDQDQSFEDMKESKNRIIWKERADKCTTKLKNFLKNVKETSWEYSSQGKKIQYEDIRMVEDRKNQDEQNSSHTQSRTVLEPTHPVLPE